MLIENSEKNFRKVCDVNCAILITIQKEIFATTFAAGNAQKIVSESQRYCAKAPRKAVPRKGTEIKSTGTKIKAKFSDVTIKIA